MQYKTKIKKHLACNSMRKKVCVLMCGGTIVMTENVLGVLAPPDKNSAINAIQYLAPGLEAIVDWDVHFIANIDSSDMTPAVWDRIAQEIYDRYAEYDGFVLTHGTDTMAYTASALSFSLHKIGKPVILTGAQIPGNRIDTDARRNFVNAMRLATENIAGVWLVFGDRLILGCRASKVSHSKIDAFESVNVPPFGEIGTEIRITHPVAQRHSHAWRLQKGFDSHVCVVSLVPGMPSALLMDVVEKGVHGIVLVAFGTGNIPHSYLPFLERCRSLKIPVVVRSQCLEGSTKMEAYETGRQALQFNAIQAMDMSLESTITKLMWTLHKKMPYEEIESAMLTDSAGEVMP
jgi:L-asparaginase